MNPSLRVGPKFLAVCCVLGAALLGPRATAQTTARTEAENPEEFSRVRGLFDVDLPKTIEKFKTKLIVHPHFGDLLHRGYLRVPVGIRMGLNDRTEMNAEAESFLTHGLRKPHAGYGLDRLSLGMKYQWSDWLKEFADTSTGFNFTAPVGRPPVDLTDGFNHFSPYVTFSKRLAEFPRLTPFLSFNTDLMWKSSVPGSFQKNQPRSDSMGTSVGFFYDRDQFKYTLVCSYGTTALIGEGNRNFYSVNPSVLWDLPPWLKFHSRGQWIFGLGLKANFGPDGTDFGTSAKLRGEFKFSRWWRAR